jgi:hypothetical protein
MTQLFSDPQGRSPTNLLRERDAREREARVDHFSHSWSKMGPVKSTS